MSVQHKKKRPRTLRLDRLREIDRLLAAQHSGEIVRDLSAQWNVTERQVYRYIAEIRKRWNAIITENLTQAKTQAVADLTAAIAQAKARRDYAAMARIYDTLSKYL
jgi:transcriptional antiterminator